MARSNDKCLDSVVRCFARLGGPPKQPGFRPPRSGDDVFNIDNAWSQYRIDLNRWLEASKQCGKNFTRCRLSQLEKAVSKAASRS
jgi:hypothetical protein